MCKSCASVNIWGSHTCLFAKCHIPGPLCGSQGRPVHLYAVSVSAVWQPVNTCLHACHVPCDGTGVAVCTSTMSQHHPMAMWAGIFAHVPCPHDNVWWHKHICIHWCRVPTFCVPVLEACWMGVPVHHVLVQSCTSVGVPVCTPVSPCHLVIPRYACLQTCHVPELLHGSLGGTVHIPAMSQGHYTTA